MSCDKCRTVCVWDQGGVHQLDDRMALAKDLADALGARAQDVEVTNVEPEHHGAWLTVRVFAPEVPVDWASR